MIGQNRRGIVLKYVDFGLAVIGGRKIDFDIRCLFEVFELIADRTGESERNLFRDIYSFDFRYYGDLRDVIRAHRFVHPREHDRLVSGRFYALTHWLRHSGRHPDWFFADTHERSYKMPYKRKCIQSLPEIYTARSSRPYSESEPDWYSFKRQPKELTIQSSGLRGIFI